MTSRCFRAVMNKVVLAAMWWAIRAVARRWSVPVRNREPGHLSDDQAAREGDREPDDIPMHSLGRL